MAKGPQCTCTKYPFPHRLLSGQCLGWDYLSTVFQERCLEAECPHFHHEQGYSFCLVLDGGVKDSSPEKCPVVAREIEEAK